MKCRILSGRSRTYRAGMILFGAFSTLFAVQVAAAPSGRRAAPDIFKKPRPSSCDWLAQGEGNELPAGWDVDVQSPRPPQNPKFIPKFIQVSSTEALFEAVANAPEGQRTNIFLLPGEYECRPAPVRDPTGLSSGTAAVPRHLEVGRTDDYDAVARDWRPPVNVHLYGMGKGHENVVLKFGVQFRERTGGLHNVRIDIDEAGCGAPHRQDGKPVEDSDPSGVVVQRGRGFPPAICFSLKKKDGTPSAGSLFSEYDYPGQGNFDNNGYPVGWEWDDCAEFMQSEVVVEDVVIDGGGVLHAGLLSGAPSGNVFQRLEISDTLNFGLEVRAAQTVGMKRAADLLGVYVPPRVEDVFVQRVSNPELRSYVCGKVDFGDTPVGEQYDCIDDPSRRYFPGITEAGIALDVTSTARRLKVRDVAWAGIRVSSRVRKDVATSDYLFALDDTFEPEAQGNDYNASLLEDVSVDRLGRYAEGVSPNKYSSMVGVYFERATDGAILQDFCVGPSTSRGVMFEYHQNRATPELTAIEHATRARDVTVQRGLIDSSKTVVVHDLATCIVEPDPITNECTGRFPEKLSDGEYRHMNSIGVLPGVHSEGLMFEDLRFRNIGCTAYALQMASPDFSEYSACSEGFVHPLNQSPPVSSLPYPVLECSTDPDSEWFTPWCPFISGSEYDSMTPNACRLNTGFQACKYEPIDRTTPVNEGNGFTGTLNNGCVVGN